MKITKCLVKFSIKDLKKKSTVVILILVAVNALLISALYRNLFIHSIADEYYEGKLWPTEIIVNPSNSNSNYTPAELAEAIKKIEGVSWLVVNGDGFFAFDAFYYKGKSYSLILSWCNVKNPTFPNPKFLVEGKFFGQNNEDAIIIESYGQMLLKNIGLNATIGAKISFLDMRFTLEGVIANPLEAGREESVLALTNVLHFYVPLETYYRLISCYYNESVCGFEISQHQITISGLVTPPGDTIYVKVAKGYSVKDIANKIKEISPEATVRTIVDAKKAEKQYTLSSALSMILPLFVFISLLLVWEARHRKNEIAIFKSLGWQFKDLLYFFIIRNVILSLIASLLGFFFILLWSEIVMFGINWYLVEYHLQPCLISIPIVVATTLLSSAPALYFVYREGIETAIRE